MPIIGNKQKWWPGHAVSQEHRDDMAQRVFDYLAASKKENDESDISTGDAAVYGFKYTAPDGSVTIEIKDCTVRRSTIFDIKGSVLY